MYTPAPPSVRPRYFFYYDEPPGPPGRTGGVRRFFGDVASLVGGVVAVPVGLALLEMVSR
ncbi:hypothetical protein [Actinomadura algeriensis]|uniref:Uncharacterized protein n=1 Tax=Actinomadura algeriensis TaxID=1679523 RepID=A0ABR9JSA4_9ACTN|nr:hypothetical protein [Actinomadura algeriensis]MBE1533436.1 hypothetical protein [Actinomadura algeriensis]